MSAPRLWDGELTRKFNYDEFISEVVAPLKSKLTESVDVQIVLHDLYETHIGIYNHLDATGVNGFRPLASVAFHPSEDINMGSKLEDSMLKYVQLRIWDHWHIGYDEFMNRPTDVVRMHYELAEKLNKKHAEEQAKIEAEIAKAKGLPPKG